MVEVGHHETGCSGWVEVCWVWEVGKGRGCLVWEMADPLEDQEGSHGDREKLLGVLAGLHHQKMGRAHQCGLLGGALVLGWGLSLKQK